MPEDREVLAAPGHIAAAGGADHRGPGETRGARRGLAAATGAVGSAFVASLCCIGPLVVVYLGVGAGLASTFAPLRPLFAAATVVLLALGFYLVYRRRPAAGSDSGASCGPGASRRAPRRRRDVVLLWLAAGLALVFLTFPQWSTLLV